MAKTIDKIASDFQYQENDATIQDILDYLEENGGGGGLATLPAGVRVGFLGDSILDYSTYSVDSLSEYSTQARGEITWLKILDSRYRIEDWRNTSGGFGPYTGLLDGTLGSNPFSVSSGSKTVTVTHTAHGLPTLTNYIGGAEYVFSGATAVGGITISGGYKVLTVPNANTFTIEHSVEATSTVSGGGSAVAFKQRGIASFQARGAGSNWGAAGDHILGSTDLLKTDNGFPTSGAFLDVDVDVIIIAIGTNPVNSSVPLATMQTQMTALINAALAHPKKPRIIVCTIRPRDPPRTEILPDNPFATTNTSAVVVVNHPNHPYQDGQTVTFTGASAVGGLTITGPYTISSTNFTADSYQFTHGSTATSTVTAGGGVGVSVVNASAGLIWPLNDPRWVTRAQFNTWLKGQNFGSRVSIADMDEQVLDDTFIVDSATGTKGAAKKLHVIDGVHISPVGAYYGARYGILPKLQAIIDAGGPHFNTNPNASGNFLRNPSLSGTSGLASTGCTGSLPNNWLAQRTAGSSLSIALAKSTIVAGIDKITATMTSAGSSGFDSFQIRPANNIAWNRSVAAASITVTPQSAATNPVVRVLQSGMTNGHPIVGSTFTVTSASTLVHGVNLVGSWVVTNVLDTTSSTCTFEFIAVGQTSTNTTGVAVTADYSVGINALMPADSWIQGGCYVEVGAWDKWRNIQLLMSTRNVSTATMNFRTLRTYNNNLRYMPTEGWEGWLYSDPIKLDTKAATNLTNINWQIQGEVENSTAGITTATLSISRPFLRVISNPIPNWSIAI